MYQPYLHLIRHFSIIFNIITVIHSLVCLLIPLKFQYDSISIKLIIYLKPSIYVPISIVIKKSLQTETVLCYIKNTKLIQIYKAKELSMSVRILWVIRVGIVTFGGIRKEMKVLDRSRVLECLSISG